MASPIFIDANVPIYAAGRPHPLRGPCRQVILLVSRRAELFVTDAEVLQEILHRYLALRRWDVGRAGFERFLIVMRDRIEPVFGSDVETAARLAGGYTDLSARDLIHLAVMRRLGSTRIVTADRDFDRVPDVTRLDPSDLDTWREQVEA